MLLSKPFNQGDIVCLKLTTSEEIIAKVVAVTQDIITVTKPMLVNIGMDERTRQVGIQMLPYFVLCAKPEADLVIKTSHIITSTLANDNAKSGYIQNTTGLAVASSGSGLIV